jgi:hypothetical protein
MVAVGTAVRSPLLDMLNELGIDPNEFRALNGEPPRFPVAGARTCRAGCSIRVSETRVRVGLAYCTVREFGYWVEDVEAALAKLYGALAQDYNGA